MKILTKRVNTIAENKGLISEEQGGFRNAMGTLNKALTIQLCMEDAHQFQNSDQEIHLLFIDLKKAYDSVPHHFLWSTLIKHGFPESFVNFIRKTHTGATAQFLTFFGPTDPIHFERGIRQGCPLSCLLFNLYMEHLIRWVNKNNRGYTFKNNHGLNIKCQAFADDIVLVCNSREELQKLMTRMVHKCKSLGLEINFSKC